MISKDDPPMVQLCAVEIQRLQDVINAAAMYSFCFKRIIKNESAN